MNNLIDPAIVEKACEAYRHPERMLTNDSVTRHHDCMTAALEAALPHLEQQIRGQVAAEPCHCTQHQPTDKDTGSSRELVGACCRHCGSSDTWLEMRLDPKPVGTWSLAGQQTKVAAAAWPYLVCDGCGHVSRGQVTTRTRKDT